MEEKNNRMGAIEDSTDRPPYRFPFYGWVLYMVGNFLFFLSLFAVIFMFIANHLDWGYVGIVILFFGLPIIVIMPFILRIGYKKIYRTYINSNSSRSYGFKILITLILELLFFLFIVGYFGFQNDIKYTVGIATNFMYSILFINSFFMMLLLTRWLIIRKLKKDGQTQAIPTKKIYDSWLKWIIIIISIFSWSFKNYVDFKDYQLEHNCVFSSCPLFKINCQLHGGEVVDARFGNFECKIN